MDSFHDPEGRPFEAPVSVSVVSPILAALMTWWTVRGELLMVPVAAFVFVLACMLWAGRFFDLERSSSRRTPTAPARSASGVPQGKFLLCSLLQHSLQQVSRPSNPVLPSGGISAGCGKS
jgi:uncharacterized membrane protein YhhN